jgi:uncharacterized protein (TIGR02145 family)
LKCEIQQESVMTKRYIYLALLILVFLSCKKPSEPVFDNVYDEQSERFIPFADLNTSAVTGILAQSATSGGQFANDYGKPVTQKGVCWSLVQIPTVEGTCSQNGGGLFPFSSTLTSLVADTLYYVRAYATNADGTTYGQQLSFRTLDGRPVFSTPVVSGIGARIATLSGSVSGDGGSSILRRGFVWSVNADPTTQDSVRVLGGGLGEMSMELRFLTPDSTYYFRAFAESGTGMHYSAGSSFKTLDGRAVYGQTGVSAITATSATVSATITTDGGEAITGRGVCYATTENPTTENTCVSSGSGTGNYSVTLTGLSAETAYYVRAYAFNAISITYSEQVAFTTTGIPPTVTTGLVSNITTSGATVAGNVTAQGSAVVTVRGVCYATTQNPTTVNTCVDSGSGTGGYAANLSGLSPGVRYYARAFATNAAGTSYGNEVEFTTTRTAPTVNTGAVSDITTTSATVAGNVISQGFSTVTTRGVCYATSQNPTTENICISSGSGLGVFTVTISGLISDTRYFVRAFAVNSAGTSYGNQLEFTTVATGGDVNGRDNTTEIVDVRNPTTGRTWMDRNLGATRAATSTTDTEAYGDLYQWGRRADGHQKRNSTTISTLNSTDVPSNDSFILAPITPNDWRSPQNNNLWQGGNGLNNPCPVGYRIPTRAEWSAERLSWSSNRADGAYATPLKIPMSGRREYDNGSVGNLGSRGYYWSSSVDGSLSEALFLSSSDANLFYFSRAFGHSVRCVKN